MTRAYINAPWSEHAAISGRASGRRSRNKGAEYERELCRDLEKYGFKARRTPNSGGLHIKGDVTASDGTGPALPGHHIEAKRHETLAIPAWLRQAHADAGHLTPVVVFRRNNTRALDPLGTSHAIVPWHELLALVAELERLRAILEPRRLDVGDMPGVLYDAERDAA